jgi:hypothetical protein
VCVRLSQKIEASQRLHKVSVNVILLLNKYEMVVSFYIINNIIRHGAKEEQGGALPPLQK